MIPRTVVLALIAIGVLELDSTAIAQSPTGLISGVVVTDETRPEVVRRAVVTLTGAELPRPRTAISDANGRFTFPSVPQGRFKITAAKPSFVTSEYGAKRPGRSGTPLRLEPGQRLTDVSIALARGAVLTGAVTDYTGHPAPGVQVTAIRTDGLNANANAAPRAITDDRGLYRIFGLAPAEYVVVASVHAVGTGDIAKLSPSDIDAALTSLANRGQPGPLAARGTPGPAARGARQLGYAYAPVFSPNTPVAASAARFTLAPGEELRGDIKINLVPTAAIEGVIVSADGSMPDVSLSIRANGPVFPISSSLTPILSVRPGSNGLFKYTGVAPGRYTLLAVTAAPAPARGLTLAAPSGLVPSRLWASAEITVTGQDISGVTMSLQPMMKVSGRVALNATTTTTPSDPTTILITLTPPGAAPASPLTQSVIGSPLTVQSVRVQPDGTFEMPGLLPGSYRVSATGAVGGWWLRSVMVSDKDVLDSTLDVSEGTDISGAIVTFTDRHSELSGMFQSTAGTPATDYFLIVFPADRALWRPQARRIQATRPATDGNYTFRDLPPGDYLIAALTDAEPGDWDDAGFLAQITPASIRVSIDEGERKTQDVRLAGRSSP